MYSRRRFLRLSLLSLSSLTLAACAPSSTSTPDPSPQADASPEASVAASPSPTDAPAEPTAGSTEGSPVVTAEAGTTAEAAATPGEAPGSFNATAPADPVKLVFIHHSTGQNWLADDNGQLALALRDNNYFLSDTNYGWGPDGIGDRTDLGHWHEWFLGPKRDTYVAAVLQESGMHSPYTRLDSDPGGENEIVMFKSCFPNSNVSGKPDDAPTSGRNRLEGVDAGNFRAMSVGNIKRLYNDLLGFFATRPDKLFVVITAPPLFQGATNAENARSARAVNDWLYGEWLSSNGYAQKNVAVFDFFNVLTSSAGSPEQNDLESNEGNHHRVREGQAEHIQGLDSNFLAYPSPGGDSHPSPAGNLKATAEYLPLLNSFYHAWKGN